MSFKDRDYEWAWDTDSSFGREHESEDLLDRGLYAEYLTKYLCRFSSQGYVMNLNADWGGGKTWFITRWHKTVKEHHPAAYIDAWKTDFSDEPLLAVMSAITRELQGNSKAQALKTRVFSSAGKFLKEAAPSALRQAIRRYTGLDPDDFDPSELAEKALEVSLQEFESTQIEIENFKKLVGNWLSETCNGDEKSKSLPMFVFIDELDRCRPTYAIELLETVKHLFDIPGLVFVIATNTDQLQHSIKSVYGVGFDANRYLQRFFNRSFELQAPNLKDYIDVRIQKMDDSKLELIAHNEEIGGVIVDGRRNLVDILSLIASGMGLDLRSTSQWIDQLELCLQSEMSDEGCYWLLLSIMLAMKLRHPDAFRQLFSGAYDKTARDKAFKDWSDILDLNKEKITEEVTIGLGKELMLPFVKYPQKVNVSEVEGVCWVNVRLDWLVVEKAAEVLVELKRSGRNITDGKLNHWDPADQQTFGFHNYWLLAPIINKKCTLDDYMQFVNMACRMK